MTLVKFRISSYFAQIISIVSCFRKYHSKVLKRNSFFEIEKSAKIATLAASGRRKWPKIVHFLFARTGQRDAIYPLHSASLSIHLISTSSKCCNILGRYTTQMFYVFYLGLLRALIAKFSLRK